MGILDVLKRKKRSTGQDVLRYKKACLNCSISSGQDHMYVWENFSSLISSEDESSHEYWATIHIKKELYDTGNVCQGCGSKGAFDIWDVRLNDIDLYREPNDHVPQTQFFFTKENGQISGEYRPVVSGSNATNLTMFALAKQLVMGIPASQFIKRDKGFVDIIAYRMDNLDCTTNRMRYSGFSREEIIEVVDEIENNYRLENDVDW